MEEPDYSVNAVREWLTQRFETGRKTFTFLKNKEDFLYLVGLLLRHPARETWKRKDPTSFYITKGKQRKTILLDVAFNPIDEKPKYRVVSWVACATQKLKKSQRPSEEAGLEHITAAMRYAIRRQISNYRRDNPIQRCVLCEEQGIAYRGPVEVDHFPERFASLRNRFIERQIKQGRPTPTEFKWHPKRGNNSFASDEASEKWKRSWLKFHRRNADFRYLCPTCNKKSTKVVKKLLEN